LVLIGSGFASAFFLRRFLEINKSFRKILVLEKGAVHSLDWQIDNNRVCSIDSGQQFHKKGLDNKAWNFNTSFGGSSNGWWGCTPRMLPNDFSLKTTYGVGYDWPFSYDEFEPFYAQAEEIMAVSGPSDWQLSPRSIPFPQPAHNMSLPDEILKKAYPGLYFPQATARARIATGNRSECCAASRCSICPTDAKFTVPNELSPIFSDDRVEFVPEAEVMRLALTSDTVSSLDYRLEGTLHRVDADLFVLGANAIFNPHLLKVSGDSHPLVGKRLHEQISSQVILDLDGIDSFQSSTAISGQGYMFYDGEHRREYGGCMTEHLNKIILLRSDFGKWRQRMVLKFIVEDLPLDANYVDVGPDDKPLVVFNEYSSYGLKALQQVPRYVEELKQHLPIEQVHFDPRLLQKGFPGPTESHIQGTVVMSNDPRNGVVDKNLVHHKYRNLIVAGGSAFPTSSPANPALTICALSLMSAESFA